MGMEKTEAHRLPRVVSEARTSIDRYLELYTATRPHSSLQAQTPDPVYSNHPAKIHGSLNAKATTST